MNIDKYKNKWFLAPDDGGGEGGGAGDGEMTRGEAAFEPIPKTTTGDPALPEKKPEGSGPTRTETEGVEGGKETTPAGGFDASKFAKEFGDTLGTTLKPILERAEPQEKMTPERARELLKVWEPDENWYKKYDNLETRAEAVGEMRDGLILQADTLNQLRINEAINKLRSEFEPHLQSMTETTNRQREERFNTQYPQLAKPELQPLIKALATDFVEQKKTFKTESELFKALASGVEAVIKVNNPEFKLETANNGDQKQVDRGGRQLPVTSPGGGGGTGRREGGQKTEKSRGLAVFDR